MEKECVSTHLQEKGDMLECKNYHGIKLMSLAMKLLERNIDRRQMEEVAISKEQFGSMPGRSTTDPIFSIGQLIEKYREGNTNLHLVFIYLEKSYNRIPRSEIWNCLRIRKVPEKYIGVIQDMYKESETQITTPTGRSEGFKVVVGVHQGSALSPFIFIIVMDTLTDNGRKRALESMIFADDLVLCGKERKGVEDQLVGWRRSLEDYRLKVCREKTEYLGLQAGHGDDGEIYLRGVRLEWVREFKYLGFTLHEDSTINNQMSGDKADTAEMRMLRWITRVARKDRMENETVRKELEIEEMSEKMRENRLRWFGHVWRSEEQGLSKRVMGLKVGRRSRGRPKRRFMDCIENLKLRGWR